MLLPNALVLGVTQNIVRGIVKATRKSKEKRKKEVLEGTDASELILSSPKKEQGTLLSLPSKVESKVSPVVPTPSISSPEVTTAPASPTKAVSPISDTVPKAPSLDAPTLPKIKGSVGENLSELIPGIGSGIKKNVEAIVRSRLPDTPVSANGLFDGIDDKTVEKSIPLAEDAIKRNLESGALGEDAADRYPNLLSGLTMFYAASERGKREAARRAREVAYADNGALLYPSALSSNAIKSQTYESLSKANDAKDLSISSKQFDSIPAIDEDAEFDNGESSNEYSTNSTQDAVSAPSGKTLREKAGITKETKFEKSVVPSIRNIYYGNVRQGEPQEDLYYGRMSSEEIRQCPSISYSDVLKPELSHKLDMKLLANLTSSGKMRKVALEMVDHFFDGTGTDYSNDILTKEVSEHPQTQKFMSDFTKALKYCLSEARGDITTIIDNDTLRKRLIQTGVLLSEYSYDYDDLFSGLMFTIHGWTEASVDLTSFELQDTGVYSGNLQFTFIDNFGLNTPDMEKYGFFEPFRSWFVLQHFEKYKGKYKPFKTYVTINYQFVGKIKQGVHK